MKAVVTGASGFIGRNLCKGLLQKGWSVTAVSRRAAQIGEGSTVVVAEDADKVCWERIVGGADAVFHLAAHVHASLKPTAYNRQAFERVNVVATARLARAAATAGVKRFLFLSSAGVHGDSADRPLTETAPIRPANLYTESKARAEAELVKFTDLRLTILRPPLVYGVDAPSNFRALLRGLALGLPMPFGKVDNVRSLIFVGNLVDALIRCASVELSSDVFLVHDVDLSTRELVICLSHAMGKKTRLLGVPASWFRAAEGLPLLGRKLRSLIGSFRLDSSKLRLATGWSPPYDPIPALETIARSFAGRPS